MQLAILIGLVVAIAAVAFALQNNVIVTVVFFVWRFDSSLAMVLLIAVAVGALVVALFSTPSVLRLQWTVVSLRRQVNSLELANGELRAQANRGDRGGGEPDADAASPLQKMAPQRPPE